MVRCDSSSVGLDWKKSPQPDMHARTKMQPAARSTGLGDRADFLFGQAVLGIVILMVRHLVYN